MQAGKRAYTVLFIRAVTTTDNYNQSVEDWGSPTTLSTVTAQVTFGTGQETRQAAQQAAQQTASFDCLRTPTLDAVTPKDRISFDSSQWGIVDRQPLDRKQIRFTAVRIL